VEGWQLLPNEPCTVPVQLCLIGSNGGIPLHQVSASLRSSCVGFVVHMPCSHFPVTLAIAFRLVEHFTCHADMYGWLAGGTGMVRSHLPNDWELLMSALTWSLWRCCCPCVVWSMQSVLASPVVHVAGACNRAPQDPLQPPPP
jgi:hypothetical protein